MEGFTKLFRGITKSSLWAKDAETVRCWVFLMAEADQHGNVICTVPGLALSNRITIEKARSIIADFLAPDPDSGTPEFEGRRIEVIDRGWKLLNYIKFREMESDEQKATRDRLYAENARLKAKLERENMNDSAVVARSRSESQIVASVAQAKAEAKAEAEEFKPNKEKFPEFNSDSWNFTLGVWESAGPFDSPTGPEKPASAKGEFKKHVNSENWYEFIEKLDWAVTASKSQERKWLGYLVEFIKRAKWKDIRPPSPTQVIVSKQDPKASLSQKWD